MIGLEDLIQYKVGTEGGQFQDQSPCSDLIEVTPQLLQVQPDPMNRVSMCISHSAGTGAPNSSPASPYKHVSQPTPDLSAWVEVFEDQKPLEKNGIHRHTSQ